MKKGQLTVSSETALRMAEVFEANEPADSAVVLRLAAAREKRRLARGETRMRRRYAWGGALAMVCFGGTALGLAVQTGYVKVGPVQVDTPEVRGTPKRSGNRGSWPSAAGEIAPDELGVDEVQARPNETTSSEHGRPISKGFEVVPVTDERSPVPSEAAQATDDRGDVGRNASEERQNGEATNATRWQEVAGAMRNGEDERAREAIAPLKESDDPETRDSAELVQLRIELGIHQSGVLHATSSQRTRLQRLVEQGASATIRASARRLQGRLAPVGVRDFGELEK